MHLTGIPCHETFAERFINQGDIADALLQDWGVDPHDVVSLLCEDPGSATSRILASMLSGPIDIDKMDYLFRDSLHAGVPYGRHFDQPRLIGSLCLNASEDGLAISEKGKTAAELLVFARYVMFSEVYWHHGVRSATAMLQRAFHLLRDQVHPESLFGMVEGPMIAEMRRVAGSGPASDLLEGIFGPTRRLYKRLAQYSFLEHREIYERLARRPYPWLVHCAEHFAEILSSSVGQGISHQYVLFDAPPVDREVQIDVDIFYSKDACYRSLGDVSPVVRTLAKEQFDDYVKRVRVFIHPGIVARVQGLRDLSGLVSRAIDRTEEEGLQGA
jgi:HD superfamily phosphohydrolase